MAITTTDILTPQVQQTYNERILSTPIPNYIHSVPAMKMTMPKNGGNTLRMSRYERFPTSPVPLGNTGVTPPAVTPERTDIDVEMQFYGQYTILNEQVTLTCQDPVLTQMSLRLGDSLRATEDELIRDMLAGTAGMINCTGGVNGDSPTDISAADVATVVKTLVGNNAKTIGMMREASTKYGTAPIAASYFTLSHSDLTSDLNDVDGFVRTNQYPSQQNIATSEWGSIQNLRFLISSEGSKTTAASASGEDVYNNFVVGMEAYTMVEQDALRAQFIYRPPIYSGPLAQNASVGWKMGFASRITNDLWVINMRCTRLN